MDWKILGPHMWGAKVRALSFLIILDKEDGFFCSYKKGSGSAIIFHEEQEFSDKTKPCPVYFRYDSLSAAQSACERKCKKLLFH